MNSSDKEQELDVFVRDFFHDALFIDAFASTVSFDKLVATNRERLPVFREIESRGRLEEN